MFVLTRHANNHDNMFRSAIKTPYNLYPHVGRVNIQQPVVNVSVCSKRVVLSLVSVFVVLIWGVRSDRFLIVRPYIVFVCVIDIVLIVCVYLSVMFILIVLIQSSHCCVHDVSSY